MRRHIGFSLGLVAAALWWCVAAGHAESWPDKPVKIIIPLQAGGAADILTRVIASQLASDYKQPFVVEDHPGAGGTIGAAQVARSEPDGYTLMVHTSAFTISPAAYANLQYDVVKSFTAVTCFANLPNVLVISPAKGVHTLRELVNRAQQSDGKFTYATVGAGSASQLTAERLRLAAGFKAVQVPYKGAPDALVDVAAGRVDMFIGPITAALALIKAGKLVPIAVSSPSRASALPDVPTMAEAGYPNTDLNFWMGMFAPKGTPHAIVESLYRSIANALKQPDIRQKFKQLGAEPLLMDPEHFAAYVRDEVPMYAALAKAAGIKPN